MREAVEILIRGHGEALSALAEGPEEADIAEYRAYLEDVAGVSSAEVPFGDDKTPSGTTAQDIYRAACRVAMRLVVILFAESRELLPRDNALYHESYGLNGLLEQLERGAARGGALSTSFGAWPRVLALFRLVQEGSHHPDLPVTAYGGDLFAPGVPDAADGLSRALFVFENACFDGDVLPDRDVHEMLTLLTRTTIRIRQGRGGTRAVVPVDFSDLSSEYTGILYEGLLDYELKTAPPGDPVIFLAVGDQPALPLSRLEAMEERALKTLFERLKESTLAADDASDGADTGAPSVESAASAVDGSTKLHGRAGADLFDGAEEPDEEAEDEALSLEVRDASPEYLATEPDERQQSRTRAETWARRAVKVAGLVKMPRGRNTPERGLAFESRLGAKAKQLVARVVLPGEWYLVRWGGTRKGSGSFYTRPGLAVPTVQRTLRPLAYDPPAGPDGTPAPDAPAARWTPKFPEEILGLTVCDPACGSGTFPLAALRFLTDALYASLQHHGRIEPDGERALVRLLGIEGGEVIGEGAREESGSGEEGEGSGAASDLRLGDELIPCPPDDERFEPRLKAVLRRHVVERCIYAVDLDPLAVELCRLSLWIETMDRTLPFGFLDHKVKCGLEFMMNSDAHRFPPRPQWEAKGYRPDEYSRWLLGDWRPIEELWQALGVNPTRPEPAHIELEEWLFDATAQPEGGNAEARFVYGHLLKPGDVARTHWRLRCAQPPYDGLPIARVNIPTGVILSRDGSAWIQEDGIADTALPLMQGAMLNQFDFSQKRWVSGTGLQARWEPIGWGQKVVDPQFLMSTNDAGPNISTKAKVAFRRIAGNTDARTMIASVVARMPCGDTASVLDLQSSSDLGLVAMALNSFAVDAIVRLRIARTHVDYHYAREVPLPVPKKLRSTRSCAPLGLGLSFPTQIASPEWIVSSSEQIPHAWRTRWFSTDHARIRARVCWV